MVVQPADVSWLRYTLTTTQKVLQPVHTYLMTYATEEVTDLFPECFVVSLARLPFTYDDVAKKTHGRHVWTYLVQLAHLYAADVLVLTRPVLCLDADAAVLQPIRLDAVGTRHGTNPYVFAHMHTLVPFLRKEIAQSADVPYYVFNPTRLQAMHVAISHANNDTPFWRLYLDAILPNTHGQGASDKELYVTWEARTHRPCCVPVVWKRITYYNEVTPLLAAPKDVQVVTCSPQGCVQETTWTRIQRWLGGDPLPSIPIPPAALAGRTPGTVVHFGVGNPEQWAGWTYIGVDVTLDVCVDTLPIGSLAVCTEFLPRLCYAHALTFLLRLRRTYPTVLFVEFIPKGTPRINVDHPTGDQGVLWWDLPPFNAWDVVEHGRVPLDKGTLVVHVMD